MSHRLRLAITLTAAICLLAIATCFIAICQANAAAASVPPLPGPHAPRKTWVALAHVDEIAAAWWWTAQAAAVVAFIAGGITLGLLNLNVLRKRPSSSSNEWDVYTAGTWHHWLRAINGLLLVLYILAAIAFIVGKVGHYMFIQSQPSQPVGPPDLDLRAGWYVIEPLRGNNPLANWRHTYQIAALVALATGLLNLFSLTFLYRLRRPGSVISAQT